MPGRFGAEFRARSFHVARPESSLRRRDGKMRRVLALLLAAALACVAACRRGGEGGMPIDAAPPSPAPSVKGGLKMTLRLTSTAFEEGGMIPSKYTCDGDDVSP